MAGHVKGTMFKDNLTLPPENTNADPCAKAEHRYLANVIKSAIGFPIENNLNV